MAFAIFVDVVIVLLVLYRQRQVRPVRARVNLRLAGILAFFGLIELIDFSNDHHLSGSVVGILVLSLLVGAGALGAIRAATVRIWANGGLVLRQGTWLTIGLWLFSLALHFAAEWWIDALKGPSGLASSSLLLYLGLTYGVQNAVVHHRARSLLAAAGPIDARSEPLAGRWWGGGWVGTPGGPGGPFRQGGNSPGRPTAHPGAIDVPAEPLPPQPRPERGGPPESPPPGPSRR